MRRQKYRFSSRAEAERRYSEEQTLNAKYHQALACVMGVQKGFTQKKITVLIQDDVGNYHESYIGYIFAGPHGPCSLMILDKVTDNLTVAEPSSWATKTITSIDRHLRKDCESVALRELAYQVREAISEYPKGFAEYPHTYEKFIEVDYLHS